MNCRKLAAAVVGLAIISTGANAQGGVPVEQRDFSGVEIVTTDLGNGTYLLEGRGNITVAVGDDGVVLVDSSFGPLHEQIRTALAEITDLPVRYVISTHHHTDHTHGNAAFVSEGAIIVAHENVNKNFALANRPIDPATFATETYTDMMTLRIPGVTAELRTPGVPAQTDGDTYVYFPDANVLAVGDIYYSRSDFPNVGGGDDIYSGINGIIAAIDEMIALADDNTKVVSGHGPLSNRAEMIAMRDFLAEARTRVENLIAEGKTLEEVQAARPFADAQARFDADDQGAERFTRDVYIKLNN